MISAAVEPGTISYTAAISACEKGDMWQSKFNGALWAWNLTQSATMQPSVHARKVSNAGSWLPRIRDPTPDPGSNPGSRPPTTDPGSYPGSRIQHRIPDPTPDPGSNTGSWIPTRIPAPTRDPGSNRGSRLQHRILDPTPDRGSNAGSWIPPRIPDPTPDPGSNHGRGNNAFFSIFYGVHFGRWRRQNSAKHPPGRGISKEDGMGRHPHRPQGRSKHRTPRGGWRKATATVFHPKAPSGLNGCG